MEQLEQNETTGMATGRRNFLKQVLLGGGVSLLTAVPGVRLASASGVTEALLLSCMDYRLIDDTERYMSERGLRDRYDHVVLAGASLGAVTEEYPAWRETFWEHLEISIQLHDIKRVILMDHRDCGAYKVVLGTDLSKTPGFETDTHALRLTKLKGQISERYPQLAVETLLMALDGSVESVG